MSTARRGLGSGISVLLGNNPVFNTNISSEGIKTDDANIIFKDIPIDKIYPNPKQPRKSFNEESLNELSLSIKAHGILQPILVEEMGDDNFSIIAGERRYRASKIAQITQIPCIVLKNRDMEQKYQVAILENIQREDLNPIEEAQAYQFLIDNFNYTHEKVAEKVNKSRSYITNSLRMLKLPEKVIDMVSEGNLTSGHAKILSGIDSDLVENIAEKIKQDKMSVKDLTEYVKEVTNKQTERVRDAVKGSKAIRDQIAKITTTNNQFDKNQILQDIAQGIGEITGHKITLTDNTRNIFMNIEIGSVGELARMVDAILQYYEL